MQGHVRSQLLLGEVEAAVAVRHTARQLAVVDTEIGTVGSQPSVLARLLVSRTTPR